MAEMKKETFENPIWDIAKIVMAFLVVGIHTHAGLPSAGADFFIEQWAAQFAVPMFFCLAGYFLFSKVGKTERLLPPDTDTVKKYWLRILRMYVLWSIICVAVKVMEWIRVPTSGREILDYFVGCVLRGSSLYHFWYLTSLFTAVFLIWALHRFLRLRSIAVIAFVCFLFGLLWLPHFYLIRGAVEASAPLSALFDFLNRVFIRPRNGVCFAFVFVVLGALLGKGELRPMQGKRVWFFVFLFCALSFLEIWWIRRQNNGDNETYGALQLSLLPATYFLFSALAQIRIAPRPFYRTLRKYSTLIYCIHPFFISVVERLYGIEPVKVFFLLPFTKWIFIFTVSFFASVVWVSLEENPKFRFLKVMH